MKRLYSLLLAAVICVSVFASDYKNQISVSGGPFSPASLTIRFFANDIIKAAGYDDFISLENPQYYGAYTFAYHNELVSWFQIGFKLNYEYLGADLWSHTTDPTIIAAIGGNNVLLAKNQIHTGTAMLSMQFTYLNTDLVKLYSGIDIGAGILAWERSEVLDKDLTAAAAFNSDVKTIKDLQEEYGNGTDIKFVPSGNLTLLGLNVGRRVYGLAEINIGLEALAKIGFGVRF